jgi:hypothetical protein
MKGTNMQNLTHIPTNNQPRISGAVTPEIAEAMRTLRAADFRLESEYHAFGDWESRIELADGLRATLDDLDERQADVIARVADDLDSELEDFSEWDTRCDAARRVRTVIRSVEKGVAADA